MRISVVIPTFNAGPDLARLLRCLREQKPAPPDEIIVIDSGSRDQTCADAQAAGARVIHWKQPFNHGLTRDAGIAAASGDVVFLTVQDAVPLNTDFLARLGAHFQDSSVAGVTSRQIPPPDGPLELQIKSQLDSVEAQRVSLTQHPGYASYTPAQRLELYRFDNVCAALRRSVWEKLPFGACRYAEDCQWARRALEAGYTLVHDPSAPVVHAHERRFVYEFRRGVLDAWVLDETFGFRYRMRDKLDRVRPALIGSATPRTDAQAAPRPTLGARWNAVKTLGAHVLARWFYALTRALLGRSKAGERLLGAISRGI